MEDERGRTDGEEAGRTGTDAPGNPEMTTSEAVGTSAQPGNEGITDGAAEPEGDQSDGEGPDSGEMGASGVPGSSGQ